MKKLLYILFALCLSLAGYAQTPAQGDSLIDNKIPKNSPASPTNKTLNPILHMINAVRANGGTGTGNALYQILYGGNYYADPEADDALHYILPLTRYVYNNDTLTIDTTSFVLTAASAGKKYYATPTLRNDGTFHVLLGIEGTTVIYPPAIPTGDIPLPTLIVTDTLSYLPTDGIPDKIKEGTTKVIHDVETDARRWDMQDHLNGTDSLTHFDKDQQSWAAYGPASPVVVIDPETGQEKHALDVTVPQFPPVADTTELKAIGTLGDPSITFSEASYPDGYIINVKNGLVFELDRESTATLDHETVFPAPVGRWIAKTSAGGSGGADSTVYATRYYTAQNYIPYSGTGVGKSISGDFRVYDGFSLGPDDGGGFVFPSIQVGLSELLLQVQPNDFFQLSPDLFQTSAMIRGNDYFPPTDNKDFIQKQHLDSLVATLDISVAASNNIFVSPAGDDATGARGNADRPFLTISGAKAAYTAGDVISVNPGTYTGQDELDIPGQTVQYEFSAGANVSFSGSVINATSGNVIIRGKGKLTGTSLVYNNSSGTIDLEFDEINLSSSFYVLTSTSARFVGRAFNLGASSDWAIQFTTKAYFEIETFTQANDYTYHRDNGIVDFVNTHFVLSGNLGFYEGSAPYFAQRYNFLNCNIEANTLQTGNGSGTDNSFLGIIAFRNTTITTAQDGFKFYKLEPGAEFWFDGVSITSGVGYHSLDATFAANSQSISRPPQIRILGSLTIDKDVAYDSTRPITNLVPGTRANRLDYSGSVTGVDQFSSIITTDPPGTGSGGDADSLNAQPGSYYLNRANHTGTQAWSTITGTPTTLSGYGITNAVANTTTVNGHALSSNVTVTASDVGLGNVDNTSDATKNSATATLTNKTLTSPVINSGSLGSSTVANTQSANDNSTKVSTTAYADAKVADAINDGTTTIAPSENAVFDALALKAPLSIAINDQTASYTLVLTDAGKLVRMNVASANNLTVPPNSSVAFPTGTQITVSNTGAGQVTFVPGSGVTINSAGAALKLRIQYSAATLIKTGSDTWLLSGDITN